VILFERSRQLCRRTGRLFLPRQPSNETSSPNESAEQTPSSRRVLVGFLMGCVLCLAIVVPAEIDRWNELTGEPGTAWLFDMNVDTTPYAVLFILLPVMWLFRQPLIARPGLRNGWVNRRETRPPAAS